MRLWCQNAAWLFAARRKPQGPSERKQEQRREKKERKKKSYERSEAKSADRKPHGVGSVKEAMSPRKLPEGRENTACTRCRCEQVQRLSPKERGGNGKQPMTRRDSPDTSTSGTGPEAVKRSRGKRKSGQQSKKARSRKEQGSLAEAYSAGAVRTRGERGVATGRTMNRNSTGSGNGQLIPSAGANFSNETTCFCRIIGNLPVSVLNNSSFKEESPICVAKCPER